MFYEFTSICSAHARFQILLIFTKDTAIEIAYWTWQLKTNCCAFFISLKYLTEQLNVTSYSCVGSKYLPMLSFFKKCFDYFYCKKNHSIVLPVACYYVAHTVTAVLSSWSKNSLYLISVCEPVISHFISIYFLVFFKFIVFISAI